MEIQRLGTEYAAAARTLCRRAIRQTEGREYSPTQVEVWLSGMTEASFRRRLEATHAIGAIEAGERWGLRSQIPGRSPTELTMPG